MAVKEGVTQQELESTLAGLAEQHQVPGAAVGVFHDGEEHYAFHGITSIENPLPVDENTLFQFGSTGKTYTATAMMRLVEQGKVDLDAPVRTYLPDFKLKDEETAKNVTVLQLFNHTAGWQGDFSQNTGDGDDALAKYVAAMAEIEQTSPLGSTVSYNNASLSVAGHIIATITGTTYEAAMKELIFEPLGLTNTWFFTNDIMTRRFVCGHDQKPDDTIKVSRPWALPRSGTPAGGMSANAEDQIKWAKFHLGDGTVDGTQVLTKGSLDRMKEPTVEMRGSAIGDYVGISWLIDDKDEVRLVGHGGTTNGQLSEFTMVPDRNFAVIVLTNCAPNGAAVYREIVRWSLKAYLGIELKDPEAVKLSDEELAAYTGHYETIAVTCDLTAEDGGLSTNVEIKPEMLKQLRDEGEDPGDQPPIPLGLLPGDGDRYIVTGGPAQGMTGYFVRGEGGDVEAVHIGGRLATRVPT
ncbi:MAG: serine hydrolase domain-containing protein [Actinomycetota bacterium]